MRDKVAIIVQSAMGRAVSDTKAGIMPPSPHLYSDLILALEVEGQTAPDKCGHPKGEKCSRWNDGKLAHGCLHNSHGDVDYCLQINYRTATINDLITKEAQ